MDFSQILVGFMSSSRHWRTPSFFRGFFPQPATRLIWHIDQQSMVENNSQSTGVLSQSASQELIAVVQQSYLPMMVATHFWWLGHRVTSLRETWPCGLTGKCGCGREFCRQSLGLWLSDDAICCLIYRHGWMYTKLAFLCFFKGHQILVRKANNWGPEVKHRQICSVSTRLVAYIGGFEYHTHQTIWSFSHLALLDAWTSIFKGESSCSFREIVPADYVLPSLLLLSPSIFGCSPPCSYPVFVKSAACCCFVHVSWPWFFFHDKPWQRPNTKKWIDDIVYQQKLLNSPWSHHFLQYIVDGKNHIRFEYFVDDVYDVYPIPSLIDDRCISSISHSLI